MKRILLILLVFLIISLSAFAKERVALVIGNGSYKVDPLSNPVNDARDMASMLGELGFNVTLKLDADQMVMESAIEAFGEKLNKNTVGLFYFSGHGAQYEGENYLIPVKSIRKISAARHLRYKAVPAGYVLGTMQDNGLNIVILDACRNNPFKGFSKSLGQGLTRMANAEGSLIAYATAPGTVAWTGETGERNSPYTKHLLRFMKQPNLSIESLLKKVRKAVIQETRNTRTVQTPWYEASISDDFYFNLSNIANIPRVNIVNYAGGIRYEGQLIGQIKNGRGIMTWPSGDRYEGEWRNDKANGQGIKTWPDGSRYEGEWRNHNMNGQGIMTWPSGERYEGEWRNDQRNGRGVMTWPSGERYEGEWINDQRNGQGIIIWPNGDRYEGEWRNNNRNGRGRMTWPDGRRYDGEWRNDQINGQGVYIDQNGTYEGKWKNGKMSGG